MAIQKTFEQMRKELKEKPVIKITGVIAGVHEDVHGKHHRHWQCPSCGKKKCKRHKDGI